MCKNQKGFRIQGKKNTKVVLFKTDTMLSEWQQTFITVFQMLQTTQGCD